VVNNLRDIPSDTAAGKRTLAVRLGDPRTRSLFVGLVVAAFGFTALAAIWRLPTLLAALAIPVAAVPARAVVDRASGPALIAVLGATGRAQLAYGSLFAAGLAFGG
jgi:1,4-dihydroxy-2-naphthoate octaprenyltransferase